MQRNRAFTVHVKTVSEYISIIYFLNIYFEDNLLEKKEFNCWSETESYWYRPILLDIDVYVLLIMIGRT